MGGARSRAARRKCSAAERYDRKPLTTAPTAMADTPRARRRPRPSSSFLRFLLRRAAALVLLAVGITLVVFVLTQLVPSNAVATNLSEQAAADPAAVAAFKAHYGLDKPLPVRYGLYLKRLVQGDLGQSSLTHDAVTHDLGQFIPATAELALYSIVIAAVLGITFGVIAALRRNRPADHILRVVSLGGISMPTFWIALVALYLGFFRLGWFPGAERLDPGVLPPPHKTGLYTIDALLAGQWGLFGQALHHLVLPALVLAAFSVGLLTRSGRSHKGSSRICKRSASRSISPAPPSGRGCRSIATGRWRSGSRSGVPTTPIRPTTWPLHRVNWSGCAPAGRRAPIRGSSGSSPRRV
jgi:ABC-type dipeptide/oligopeptide/nickel transport system permease component